MTATIIPVLPSPDFDATAAFYTGLGFVEAGRWPDSYLIVVRSPDIELHFWHNPDLEPLDNDASCYIRFDAADEARALYDSWGAAPTVAQGDLRPPEETDYGLLEFALIDPHANLLKVGGRLDPDPA